MKNVLKNILKKSAILTLAVSMTVPSVSILNVNAAEATLIKTYDFNEGLREFYDTDTAYKIISAGGQILQKAPEEREDNERADANGFIVQGSGAETVYVKQSPANQPSAKYDDEKGTVLFIAGTYDVPELVKEVSGVVEGDEEAATYLDQLYPVGSVVRNAATFKCAMTCTNPFKKADADIVTLAFWGMVPSDSQEEKIAFVEFSNGTASVSFSYDASVSRGEWHYYEYVIGATEVTSYVDGAASEISPVIDGAAPANMADFVKNATIYFGATNTSSLITVEETVLDDVSFYNGGITADEAKAEFDSKYADMNKTADIDKPLSFIAFDSTDDYTDLNAENPSPVEDFNINGHKVPGVAVVENKKGGEKNGIKVDNPYSGLELEGITVGYWIQVEPTAKAVEKNTVNSTDPEIYTGKYPGELVVTDTAALSFIDTTKSIFDSKHGTYFDGFSSFYTKTHMQANFNEGYYNENREEFGNLFEIDLDDDMSFENVEESRNWHYITLVITNDGAQMYRDGVEITGFGVNKSPRFMDGYYRRVSERSKISNFYGAFGGSGNQLATLMMSFLTYEDTDMYFGWIPTDIYRNEITSPINVTRMSCYDMKMSEEEVAALYNKEISAINEMPEYVEMPDYTLGDLNNDTKVNALDALIVLKVAAKIETSTDEMVLIGDMNGDGALDARDALSILKIAAKLN